MSVTGRTLVIETASEACSVALFEGAEVVARDHRILGRGHAEQLVPMIAALPDKGKAGRILVSLGPGSFTGVRIGIASARALGFAWRAEVLGYPTLALVAAIAREESNLPVEARRVTVCMNGGHGEWFVQDFDALGIPEGEAASLSPKAVSTRGCHSLAAGNRAKDLIATQVDGLVQALEVLPDAAHAMLLPGAALTADLTPIYGRGPDAKPLAQQIKQ